MTNDEGGKTFSTLENLKSVTSHLQYKLVHCKMLKTIDHLSDVYLLIIIIIFTFTLSNIVCNVHVPSNI